MLLKILPVRVVGNKACVDTFAFLDDGATITIIAEKLARKAGLTGTKTEIKIVGIKGDKFSLNNCEKIDFSVIGAFGKRQVKGAVTSNNVKFPSQSVPSDLISSLRLPHNVNLSPYCSAQVQILICQDNWQFLTTHEIIPLENGTFAASRSLLGWALHGPAYFSSSHCRQIHSIRESYETCEEIEREKSGDERLEEMIKLFFRLEAIGANTGGINASEYDRAQKILDETSLFTGEHWETGLLWKRDRAPDVNSYPMAFKRLKSLENRLDRDPEYARLYYKEMQRFIDKGYAVKVANDETRDRIWYLPHFGVRNVNKPNKIRLVFDAAAKANGISFNDQLETGPDLLQSLAGVLIRFRQYKIAVKGDITDMFLRVKVREADRGAQRFLWRGACRDVDPDELEMTTLLFGSKPSPCSAIYIKDKNAETFKLRNSDAHISIKENSYMDDFLASRETEEETKKLVDEVIKINRIAGFEMHAWASNSPLVIPSQPEQIMSKVNETPLCDNSKERVLGLFWDTADDSLKFNVECSKIPTALLNGSRTPSKREVLRVGMSVYDPLGILSFFTLKTKMLLQEIWCSGVAWDNKIRDEEHEKWLAWVEELKGLGKYQIPRCMSVPNFNRDTVQLHLFCDASLSAFAAVAYLRFEGQDGEVHLSLMMAKSRIVSRKCLKTATVPRLELQAALLGARLAKYVQNECKIKISRRYLWSDSTTVLHWIRGEPRTRHIFVAHRLGEIAELTEISEWVYVPTNLNPADYATRFTSNAPQGIDHWFNGPSFLRLLVNEWPKEKILDGKEKIFIDKLEMRKAYVGLALFEQESLSLATRLLGWSGLLIVARRVIKMFNRWKEKSSVGKKASVQSSLELKQCCEVFWYQCAQEELFGEEMKALRLGREIKRDSKIIPLKPFLDDAGILRASGRVKANHLLEFNNNPIIFDARHFVAIALIKEYHRRFFHGSNNTVLNEIRQKFHMIGLRTALRTLASRCIVCRIRKAKPFSPSMASLPRGRLAYRLRPFSHCGLDYFGPVFVKIGRRREKRWGALFTCLTTRAVHLELANSLSADSAIMALQRLASRRGTPIRLYSDNGTNFHGAERELKEAVKGIDKEKLASFALNKSIEWTFIPPDAPHMGGAWERLVRSVKTALYTVLKDQAPQEEVLYTLLTKIEHSVNSRPLTHVSLDSRDEEALTPNHFLIGASSGELNVGICDPTEKCLRKHWKLAEQFADAFWKRWLREYLPTLIPRDKWARGDDPIKLGDIVQILDLQAPRNCWRKGTVVRIFPADDKEVRSAEVQTPYGTYTRPTRKLIKLLGVDEVQIP